jgi:hypothetical protein
VATNLRAILAGLVALGQRAPTEPLPVETTPTTLDVLFAVALTKIDQQKREVDFLDTKAIGILTATSLVVTVAPAARISGRAVPFTLLAIALLALAGGVYALLMWHIREALQERTFNFPPSPTVLYEDWINHPPEAVKRSIVEPVALAYAHNREQIGHKVDAIRIALWLLLAEVLVLVVGLVAS